jgi:uncharacterized protein
MCCRSIKLLICCLLLSVVNTCVGQSIDDLRYTRSLFATGSVPSLYFTSTINENAAANRSEFSWCADKLFFLYKYVFSSQDMESCNFHPSCSEYGLIALRQKGLFMGGLMGFDRMARCHPLSLQQYIFDPEKKKFLDPVR